MTTNKLYLLTCEAKFTPKHFFTHPLKFVIQLFTWSKINHIADTYNYRNREQLINQAVGTGYESINWQKWLKDRYSNIYAHEVKVSIDIKQWNQDTVASRGHRYDVKGSIFGGVDKVPILRKIFKKEAEDTAEFCSENPVWKFKRQGYLDHIENENTVTPKELAKELDKGLCRPRFKVWDGEKIINNIFFND